MVRPVVLACSLAEEKFEPVLAADERFDHLFGRVPARREPLQSIGVEHFLQALAKGKPLYDQATLTRYVEEDVALIERIRPDLVIGDFRLSLSISARRTKVPYATITNVYWSPYARQRYPVPELPLTRLLGVPLGQIAFDLIRPMAFATHAVPLNRVRRRFGMQPLGADLRRTYTDADFTLYADLPNLIDTAHLPSNHRFIGPIVWSPYVESPNWLDTVGSDRPVVYVTLGSSGAAHRLPSLLRGLAQLDVTVVATTAGRMEERPSSLPENVYLADYLPGQRVAERANLVVCNGGSPATYQALSVGRPVLGIPSNLDQHLNMRGVLRRGAGEAIRSERVSAKRVAMVAHKILDEPRYHTAARRAAGRIQEFDAEQRFRAFLDSF